MFQSLGFTLFRGFTLYAPGPLHGAVTYAHSRATGHGSRAGVTGPRLRGLSGGRTFPPDGIGDHVMGEAKTEARRAPPRPAGYDKKVALVLQGGGALGSYQAGVYEALEAAHYLPDWVAGVSVPVAVLLALAV